MDDDPISDGNSRCERCNGRLRNTFRLLCGACHKLARAEGRDLNPSDAMAACPERNRRIEELAARVALRLPPVPGKRPNERAEAEQSERRAG